MTDRLYYHDSFLYEFDAEVRSVVNGPRPALILDRTAFYPTSGGQIHDTGRIVPLAAADEAKESSFNQTENLRVTEVAESENGEVVHYLESPVKDVQSGTRVRAEIDRERRRDHMQQHSAQHVLSAAFVRLFNMPTVSFHMADDYCSIDLDSPSLSKEQVESAERLANEVVLENRSVAIRFVSRDEATQLGLRKLPPAERDQLRLIEIHEFDLTACGGTHVSETGQIGAILLRKTEKARQGYRVEFVAGLRAVATARRDFSTLTDSAALFSAGLLDVPLQVRKSLEEIRSLHKQAQQLQDELAAAQAAMLFTEAAEKNGRKLIVRTLSGQDLSFAKLLAQKLTRQSSAVVALLATTFAQPALVFAQSAGQPYDMGALLKEVVAKLGGRGGGSKDLAQGGIPSSEGVAAALAAAAEKIRNES
ncbi:MAG: DHHA1 domain-containing protein [Candidatus Sulfotelmatobacter sp.]